MDKSLLNSIKNIAKAIDPNSETILFGSRARGTNNEESDWDFLFLFEIEVNEDLKEKVRDQLLDLEITSGQVISSILYSKSDWEDLSVTPLFQNVEEEGVHL